MNSGSSPIPPHTMIKEIEVVGQDATSGANTTIYIDMSPYYDYDRPDLYYNWFRKLEFHNRRCDCKGCEDQLRLHLVFGIQKADWRRPLFTEIKHVILNHDNIKECDKIAENDQYLDSWPKEYEDRKKSDKWSKGEFGYFGDLDYKVHCSSYEDHIKWLTKLGNHRSVEDILRDLFEDK